MDNITRHKIILDQIHDTYEKKNHDYGNSFSRSFDKYGLTAAMVRMEDKWNRLDMLAQRNGNHRVADEKITDTMLDLANYLIMTYMEMTKDLEDNEGYME